jgi:Holliday junction resolvase-like predicted endonuclease
MNKNIKLVLTIAPVALAVTSIILNIIQFRVKSRLEEEKKQLVENKIELETANTNRENIKHVETRYQEIKDDQEEKYREVEDITKDSLHRLNETDAEKISNMINHFLEEERAFRELEKELDVSIYKDVEIQNFGERIAKGPLLDRLRAERRRAKWETIENDNMRLVTFTNFLRKVNPEWITLKFREDFNLRSTPEDPEQPKQENIIDSIAKPVINCSLIGLSKDELWAKVSVTYMKNNFQKSNIGWVVITLIQYAPASPYLFDAQQPDQVE